MTMNDILACNVRGLNKVRKQTEVERFISNHNINLFSILETKVKQQGLSALYQRLCPSWWFTHNLDWHKGGRIIVALKSDEISVDIRHCSSQIIHMEVNPLNGENFSFSFVYGANDKKGREDLFNKLESIKNNNVGLWLLMGDFNCIANINERIGQRPHSSELDPLRSCMETCEVHDLKSTRRFFTWTNKQEDFA